MPEKAEKKDIININFVCSGNTCRSYIAEAIATHLLKTVYFKKCPSLKDKVSISSAGTEVMFTEIPANTYRVLDVFEIPNIKFKPKQIDISIVRSSNLIITMATSHKKNIISRFINIDEKKIFNLLELSNIILYVQSESIYSRKTIERGASQASNIYKDYPIKPVYNKYLLEKDNISYPKSTKHLKTISAVNERLKIIKNTGAQSIIFPLSIDIEDPFGRSVDVYIKVAKLIKENIIIIFNYLFN
jgi:protein-tyrosine-phosphatase